MNSVWAFVLLFTCAAASRCPSNLQPSCQNLDPAKYKGVWYEQTRSKVFIWDFECECTQAEYTIESASPLLIQVNNTCIKKNTGKPDTFIGKAKSNTTAPAGECALEVAFFGNFFGPYLVVETDYTSYSIVVSCLAGDLSDVWILSRTRQLPNLEDVVNRIKSMGFDYSDIVYTNQTNCPQSTY